MKEIVQHFGKYVYLFVWRKFDEKIDIKQMVSLA